MTPEQWHRLKTLFEDAIAMPLDQRPEFVSQIYALDPELGSELSALLRAHDQQTLPVDRPFVRLEQPAREQAFYIGQLVLDRFEILRYLGAGGMGEVYEANDRQMGRIALKTIRPDISSNEHILSRFKREAQLARQITSPFVCRIHEFFLLPPVEERPQLALLTMEFLEGCTLSRHIDENGPLPWREAEKLAQYICQGLRAIHEAGVVHRDLKTGNIMLVKRAGVIQAVVMDFGLARMSLSFSAAAGSALTQTAAILGTPEYMAPEQFQGLETGPATDIYSFGIVLYELLAAKRPFQASTPIAAAVQRARQLSPPSSICPGIPRRFDQVVERCLEYDPSLRYQSAAEVSRALTGQSAPSPRRILFLVAGLIAPL